MYKVLQHFRDKYNKRKIYKPGDKFISDDQERIRDLINRGLIEGELPEAPSINIPEKKTYQFMTKKEIEKELRSKGIEYSPRQTKAELIELLLKGGD